jgi:hypothetical protein
LSGKVFISYRRQDSAPFAGRLYDLLSNAIGSDRIFFDVEYVPGYSHLSVVEPAIAQSEVVLVVIGPEWLLSGKLDDPHDVVRQEIETALRLDKVIIPVLADEARIPSSSELPSSIAPLIRRNAVSLRRERFRADAQGLIHAIQQALAESVHPADTRSRETVADAGWNAVKQSNRTEELRDYIARYPSTPQAYLAQQRIEELLWGEIQKSPSTIAVLTYLTEYPNGLRKADARTWLAERLDSARKELTELETQKETLEREVRLIVGPETGFRNDVFVSYSKAEPEVTKAVVAALEAEGYKTWWDTNLVSGDEFSDVIRRELVGSRAVVVIWTPTSVKSKWVKAEATMADFDDKLVPIRPRSLDPRDIPLPFNVHHCEFVDDYGALIKALKKKGVHPSKTVITAATSKLTDAATGSTWWTRILGTKS